MKITTDKNLKHFDFWGGAEDFARRLTIAEMDTVEDILEDSYPDGIDEVTLNDIFRFEEEAICEWLGVSYDDVWARIDD